jgi:hypothetical protein
MTAPPDRQPLVPIGIVSLKAVCRLVAGMRVRQKAGTTKDTKLYEGNLSILLVCFLQGSSSALKNHLDQELSKEQAHGRQQESDNRD